jgi:hypothetical protein
MVEVSCCVPQRIDPVVFHSDRILLFVTREGWTTQKLLVHVVGSKVKRQSWCRKKIAGECPSSVMERTGVAPCGMGGEEGDEKWRDH